MPQGQTNNSDTARLKRMETRLTNFMRWFGYSPTKDVGAELSVKLVRDGDELHATTPDVTIGDIAQAVYRHKMEGAPVPIYLNGLRLGVFDLGRNL